MKLNKKNPLHWVLLIYASGLIIILLPLRLLISLKKGKRANVILYGHKLNGNLLPLYRHWIQKEALACHFVSIDRHYVATERAKGKKILNGLWPIDVARIVSADVFITDHGLHHFSLLRRLTKIKFIHVLHGIPYKGYDANDFKHLHGHDQIWVSSPYMKKMHIERFGFRPDQVKITGFARVEDVLKYQDMSDEIKTKYGIDSKKKTILIAPTWKQDNRGRSHVPFNLTLSNFMNIILSATQDNSAQVIFRAHLNSALDTELKNIKNVYIMPYAKYPVAEEFLAISDVLITDWSSIGFDFLPTQRPIIYLDVEAPFRKNFSVPAKFRPGAIVSSPAELKAAVGTAINQPMKHYEKYKTIMNETKEIAHGETLDGHILTRSDELLSALVSKKL